MDTVKLIQYLNLKRKRKTLTTITKEEEEIVIDRIIKHNEIGTWFKDLNVRVRTPLICEAAYITQFNDIGVKIVCNLTPARAIKGINDVSFLQDLIKNDYTNYQFIDMNKLRNNDDKFAVAKCTKTYINEMDKMIYSCKEIGSKDVSKYEFLKKETYSMFKTELEVYEIACENESKVEDEKYTIM